MAKESRTATTQWRRVTREVRRRGKANNMPCFLCNGAKGPIDYRTQGEADREARAGGRYWEIGQPRPLALDVDHVLAHAAGGQDTLENAAPTHAICNRSAGAKGANKPPRARRPEPVNGHWYPLDGNGAALPGRAIIGTRTATHEFR